MKATAYIHPMSANNEQRIRSRERQKELITRYAEENNIEIAYLAEDGNEGHLLFDYLCEHPFNDVILIASFERVASTPKEYYEIEARLKAAGITIVSVTGRPSC